MFKYTQVALTDCTSHNLPLRSFFIQVNLSHFDKSWSKFYHLDLCSQFNICVNSPHYNWDLQISMAYKGNRHFYLLYMYICVSFLFLYLCVLFHFQVAHRWPGLSMLSHHASTADKEKKNLPRSHQPRSYQHTSSTSQWVFRGRPESSPWPRGPSRCVIIACSSPRIPVLSPTR